jgi:hypothetical protein
MNHCRIKKIPSKRSVRRIVTGLPLPVLFLLLAASPPSYGQLSSIQQADIGLTSLQSQLGAAMPTGAGISVSQIEAGTAYRPDTSLFADNKNFEFLSGGSTAESSHATTVGRYFYGPASVAPDAGAAGATIGIYSAGGWIGGDFLRPGTSQMPVVETRGVQNHSWIGSTGDTTQDLEILRRADFAITRDDFVMVYGLNNNLASVPNLMGSAYNGIAVGRSDGNHSHGTTTLDGAGRTKPEIVVPVATTSWATAVVSGAAAMVLGAADSSPGLANAKRHEVVKALLLNGATKDEPEFGGNWSRTPTSPLDPVFGAGELNVERTYHNLVAGQQPASANSTLGLAGWDLGFASSTTARTYFFEVPENHVSTVTATLAWDRQVTATVSGSGRFATTSFSSLLANMDLALFSANGYLPELLLDHSVSTVDNVEHIFFAGLVPGSYALVVTSDTAGNGQAYGLAWTNDLVVVIPEPGTVVLALAGLIPLLCARRRDRKA